MTLARTHFEYRADTEQEDDIVSSRLCDHYYRGSHLKAPPPRLSRYTTPRMTRALPIISSSHVDTRILFVDLVGSLRHVLEQLREPTGSPTLDRVLDVAQIAEIGDIVKQLASEFSDGFDISAASDRQYETTYDLIDWQSINRRQLESGIVASFGEDGEPLEFFADSLTMLQALEDDDVEVLNE